MQAGGCFQAVDAESAPEYWGGAHRFAASARVAPDAKEEDAMFWHCNECGGVIDAVRPLSVCPECGTASSQFFSDSSDEESDLREFWVHAGLEQESLILDFSHA